MAWRPKIPFVDAQRKREADEFAFLAGAAQAERDKVRDTQGRVSGAQQKEIEAQIRRDLASAAKAKTAAQLYGTKPALRVRQRIAQIYDELDIDKKKTVRVEGKDGGKDTWRAETLLEFIGRTQEIMRHPGALAAQRGRDLGRKGMYAPVDTEKTPNPGWKVFKETQLANRQAAAEGEPNVYQQFVSNLAGGSESGSSGPTDDTLLLLKQKGDGLFTPDEYMTRADAFKWFYSLPEDQLADWKQKLYAGMYYPGDYYVTTKNESPDTLFSGKVLDENVRSAFSSFLDEVSARQGFYKWDATEKWLDTPGPRLGGQGGDWNEYLTARSEDSVGILDALAGKSGSGSGGDGGGGGGGGGGGVQSYAVTDPVQLRAFANVVSQQLLGRGLNENEAETIISQFQSTEAEQGTATSGGIFDPDPETRIAKMLREMYPVESQAHDIVGMYSSFASMLAGPTRGSAASATTRGY